jgi:hypothetical protein
LAEALLLRGAGWPAAIAISLNVLGTLCDPPQHVALVKLLPNQRMSLAWPKAIFTDEANKIIDSAVFLIG